MNDKPVNEMNKAEILKLLEQRRNEPLYVGSEEFDGMTFCYVNPELVEDECEEDEE